mmetsp:Transcript_14571/g.37185  ORF Transcript_14571/g.37185 Transcript_14571/m.37185 type:complete len:159 (-) Transcript_14571:1241-1717(-)
MTIPINTFWEGEVRGDTLYLILFAMIRISPFSKIIDNRNNFFFTKQWGANDCIDLGHWSLFSQFQPLRSDVKATGGKGLNLDELDCIFMRWKEVQFIDKRPLHAGLTIAGFYYMCLDRTSGQLEGFYFDPVSVPFQRMLLQASMEDCFGFQSGAYDLR